MAKDAVQWLVATNHYLFHQLQGGIMDAELAYWAAGQGLLAQPDQEALLRIQMRDSWVQGDEQGVQDAYCRATAAAEAQPAWEEMQPETEELHGKLTRRQPVTDSAGHASQ